jgi:hypothetical protein
VNHVVVMVGYGEVSYLLYIAVRACELSVGWVLLRDSCRCSVPLTLWPTVRYLRSYYPDISPHNSTSVVWCAVACVFNISRGHMAHPTTQN